MVYSLEQIGLFFVVYSFLGWCGEVAVAAVNRRRFVNRGFINGPLCPIYGISAVSFAVFLPELKGNYLFCFLAGLILASVNEYFTGYYLEKIFQRKWWDYSDQRFNLGGYICLKNSLIWGLCAIVTLNLTNYWLCMLADHIPSRLLVIAELLLLVLTGIDALGSSYAILGLKKNSNMIRISRNMHQTSIFLEGAITQNIQKRMIKAFPNIEAEKKEAAGTGLGFGKLVLLFVIAAFLGDIIESIFVYLTDHVWVSRSSVIYGSFSYVWGLGGVMLTIMLYHLKDKNESSIFVAGTMLGGAFEYICSVVLELMFHTVFWDYSKIPFNLGGRINLLYCFFWGIVAVIWMKRIFPVLDRLIDRFMEKRKSYVSGLCYGLFIFFVLNAAVSGAALSRYYQRNAGEPPKNQVEIFIDANYSDELMEAIYPYAKFVE